jgi:hypothetical protein
LKVPFRGLTASESHPVAGIIWAKRPSVLRCRTSDESCDNIARLATHCSRCIVYSRGGGLLQGEVYKVGSQRSTAFTSESGPTHVVQHVLAQDSVRTSLVSLPRLFQPGHDIGIKTHGNCTFHRSIELAANCILPCGRRKFRNVGSVDLLIGERGELPTLPCSEVRRARTFPFGSLNSLGHRSPFTGRCFSRREDADHLRLFVHRASQVNSTAPS